MVVETTLIQRLQWFCNTVFHQIVAVVGTFILWTLFYNLDASSTFTWHTVLTSSAYIPLMAEAIVLFASENVWTLNIKRTTKYYIHGGLLFTSAIFATVGISFMIERKKSQHFYSNHAWTGLVSWILVLLSQFLGVASAKAQSLKGVLRPVWFKFAHNLIGILGYLFGIVSLCYALQGHAFSGLSSYAARLAATIAVGFVAAWTIIAALKSAFQQLKAILN